MRSAGQKRLERFAPSGGRRRQPKRGRRPLLRLLSAPVLLLSLACGGGPGDGEAPPPGAGLDLPPSNHSLLLVSIDTCRPDRLGCYGYDEIQTPRVDQLAREGALFRRVAASVPITLPSHATMLTAEYPYRHGVRNNGTYRLAEESVTLAEWLKKHGYETAAFVGAFPIDGRFGLAQGFDVYDDRFHPPTPGDFTETAERPADEVADEALRWLEENRREPFFLFLHFFDPHWPYLPPEPFQSDYSSSPYDGEIAFVDREVGRVLDGLSRLGLDDRCLVVLTGDHGEGLGEHDEETHGIFVYESTIRIPLVLRWPDSEVFRDAGLRKGIEVESQVREIDIAPTALSLLGLPPLPAGDGVSLGPLLQSPKATLDLVNYAESFYTREAHHWSEIRSVSTDRWKYVLLPREELYDLVRDPEERENRVHQEPEVVLRLRSRLEEMIEEDVGRTASGIRIGVDEETRRRLEALGYVSGAASPEEETGGTPPDPKDRIGAVHDLFEAKTLVQQGYAERGLEILRPLAEEEGENPQVWEALGDALAALGDWDEAEAIYQKALSLDPGSLNLQSDRALALRRGGSPAKALSVYEEIIASDSLFEGAHQGLGDCFLALGDRERAMEAYRKEIALHPRSPAPLADLGLLYREEGRDEEARELFLRALESAPGYGPAHFHLAKLAERAGETEEAILGYEQAIENDPKLGEAYYNLALLLKEEGRLEEAREKLEEAIGKNPRYHMSYFGLGNLLLEEGEYREAVVRYRQAVELDPNDPQVHLNLGGAYFRMGQVGAALEEWQLTTRLAPESPSGQKAMQNLQALGVGTGGIP